MPAWAQKYIHDVVTRCDPAGDVQLIADLKEQRKALFIEGEELKRELKKVQANCRSRLITAQTLGVSRLLAEIRAVIDSGEFYDILPGNGDDDYIVGTLTRMLDDRVKALEKTIFQERECPDEVNMKLPTAS